MQTHAAIASEGMEELFEQLGVHLADLVAREMHFPDQIGALAQIKARPRQRFVHRNMGVAEARDAGKIAERFSDRLTDHDAGIFDRVVHVDVQIARRLHIQIDAGMARQTVQHMVKKTDAGGNFGFAAAVEIKLDLDTGFLGGTGKGCGTGHGDWPIAQGAGVYLSQPEKSFVKHIVARLVAGPSSRGFDRKPCGQRANLAVKSKSLFHDLLRTMSLPVFAGLSASLVSILLYGVLSAITVMYRQHLAAASGQPVQGVPWLFLIVLGAVCVIFAGATAWFVGWRFSRALDTFSQSLITRQEDDPIDINEMPFVELRRLRAGLTRTVGRLKRDNVRLRELAFIDPKTGMATPTHLQRHIEETLPTASFEAPAAYFLLDIDHFSRLVDEFGTTGSERLIASIAAQLRAALDKVSPQAKFALRGHLLSHLSTDTFALYLPTAISRDLVIDIGRAIRQSFSAPIAFEGQYIDISISAGVVMAPEDAEAAMSLRPHAELALEQARKDRGSGFRFFSPNLNRLVRGKYQLEAELRQAIQNREFFPVFQPKIEFSTGRVIGAEALARWRRPNGNTVSPATFIPIAEETGLIALIGEHILEAACAAAESWRREGHVVSVAVNVSPRQFQRKDLAKSIAACLQRTALPPSLLELEITESVAVAEPEKVAEILRPLRALGIKLAIDDFGTGHSNLSALTQLPFDVFKIDRQFVSALETDPRAPAIVEMILAMAETLGLKTVAEGVETVRQADFLRRRGCTIGQGFLYSPGLPQDAFLDFLRGWQPASVAPAATPPQLMRAARL